VTVSQPNLSQDASLVKKVIRASAGTGKTYRLSLEYIALLLMYRQQGIHFSEIMVITFTRKATSEIRNRIFQHLKVLAEHRPEATELIANLHAYFELSITEDDRQYLNAVYREMLMNKHQVLISTIDSFTNTVFKTIIAPYLGLTQYAINEHVHQDNIDEINAYLLENRSNFERIETLFHRSGGRTIADYEALTRSILNQRWILYLIEISGPDRDYSQLTVALREELFGPVVEQFDALLDLFQAYLYEDQVDLPADQLLKTNYRSIFFPAEVDSFAGVDWIRQCLHDETFVLDHQDLLIKGEPFWNGQRVLRKKQHQEYRQQLLERLEQATEALADYCLVARLLPEEKELWELSRLILQRYDEIKFRDKVFTYGDISFYTFKYLYDRQLSLIEDTFVTNAFYEYLSARIRFALIDEFQDTSILQFKILLPIIREVTSGLGVKSYGGVIVVGDEKQSIYGWRGGERDLLLSIPSLLEEAESVTLDVSYRSAPEVIELINQVFSDSRFQEQLNALDIDWPYPDITAHRTDLSGSVGVRGRTYSRGRNSVFQSDDALREFVVTCVLPEIRNRPHVARQSVILSRRNEDLQKMAAILDEYGLDYVLDSSSSILRHRAIRPVMLLLRFLVSRDIWDLFRVLRSDLALIDAHQLKQIALAYRQDSTRSTMDMEAFCKRFQQVPAMAKVLQFLQRTRFDRSSPEPTVTGLPGWLFSLVHSIYSEFNLISLFGLENDLKNIHYFLQIVAQFEEDDREADTGLQGFLHHCDENERRERFQQQGLDEVDAIRLMTIHKSKGLEFETVFVYHDLSARGGQRNRSLGIYYRYDADYRYIHDYSLTFNYDNALPRSGKKALCEEKARRAAIEELNNLYVAMTRAKRNLRLYFAASKSGGWTEWFRQVDDQEEKPVAALLLQSIVRAFDPMAFDQNDHVFSAQKGDWAHSEIEAKTAEREDTFFVTEFWQPDRLEFLQEQTERIDAERHINFKTMYLTNQNTMKGNIVHYYLSYIRYNTEPERELAVDRTNAYFGTLMSLDMIADMIRVADQFIGHHPELYSSERWDHVFTEYTLFSGTEIRLDRMMVDEANREIMIVDYKTGMVYEEEQIDLYVKAVKKLPHVQKEGYAVSGAYYQVMQDSPPPSAEGS
jgi:ATP-dependent exoDNAse (exonuclease V) beta subunit